ncbi:Putative tyrosine-protein kinase in cps region [Acaryochloris thomasi RCC1774]|uniref:Tyrosine-protein kinase in cps region n=1 Tax=Acaryochloris thomasi RCC1774 TaxID=1764569 RepID=A0A2W1JD79_9CYAN|nr:hypothetical protein [Acaryochloris thomasi]PZD71726.1 Putative tyrosine-protein kinase in cps region [Acaryochloris thomasi RCC1774]
MNLIITIFRHSKFIILWNVLVLLFFLQAWKGAAKSWTATTKFALPQTTSTLSADLGTLGSLRGGDPSFSAVVNPLKTQEEILSSDNLLEKALKLDPESENFSGVSQYRNLFEVILVEKSNVFSIDAKGSSPGVALQRAKVLAQVYQKHLNYLRKADVAGRNSFYQNDLKRASQRLADAESALASYQKASGLVSSEEQTGQTVSLISELEKTLALTIAESNKDASQVQELSSQLDLLPREAVSSVSLDENSSYQLVRQKLTELESELKAQRAQLTESHPSVQTLVSNRDGLLRQLSQYVDHSEIQNGDGVIASGAEGQNEIIEQIILLKSSAIGKRQQAQDIQSKINSLRVKLGSLPNQQSRLAVLQRNLNVSKGIFNGLIAQIEKSKVDAFQSYPSVQLLNTPTLNPAPISNRLLISINALFASALGSLGLLLLLEGRNPLLRPKDLEGASFPLATRIPKLRRQLHKASDNIQSLRGGETAFLQLAYGILTQEISDRCLMVVSAMSKEGRTTISLHLAQALRDLGLKVLILSERSSQNVKRRKKTDQIPALGSMSSRALKNFPSQKLLTSKSKEAGVQVIDFNFSSRDDFKEQMHLILKSEIYDFIIVDAPPVQSSSITTLMSTVITNILLVVRPGKSTRFSVRDSLQLLFQSQLNSVGLVINDPGYLGLSDRTGWEQDFIGVSSNKFNSLTVAP